MASFFEGFLTGFAKTTGDTLQRRQKVEEEIDMERRKRIESIEPEIELEKRKQEIKWEYQQKEMDRRKELFSQYNFNTPSESAGVPSPQGENAEAIFQRMQDFTNRKAKAQATGDDEMAKFFDTQAELAKQQYEYVKSTAQQRSKPVTGSEGINIVEALDKRLADETKPGNAQYVSTYFPKEVNYLANFPGKQEAHKELNRKHQQLAQSVANARKSELTASTPETTSAIIAETEKVIRDINTLNLEDPKVTPEVKRQAAQDIKAFLNKLTPEQLEVLRNDPNFNAVMDERVAELLQQNLSEAPAAYRGVTKTEQTQQKQPKPKKDVLNTTQAKQIRQAYKSGKITKEQAKAQLEALAAQ